MISLFAAEFEEAKVGISGKGLNLHFCNTSFFCAQYSKDKPITRRQNFRLVQIETNADAILK